MDQSMMGSTLGAGPPEDAVAMQATDDFTQMHREQHASLAAEIESVEIRLQALRLRRDMAAAALAVVEQDQVAQGECADCGSVVLEGVRQAGGGAGAVRGVRAGGRCVGVMGWQCPRCARCYSPYMGQCGACAPQDGVAVGAVPSLWPGAHGGDATPLRPFPPTDREGG